MITKPTANLTQKLLFYGVSAGAASLSASAQADIHYSGAISATGDTIYFDPALNTYSTTDATNESFTLRASTFTGFLGYGTAKSKATTLTGNGIAVASTGSSLALELQNTDTIGSQAFNTSSILREEGNAPFASPYGNWQPGDHGYLGLQLTVNGQTDYGWAEVTFYGNQPVPPPTGGPTLNVAPTEGFLLSGFAYEDTGAAIGAGAVPEPGTAALLVAGAAGVAALRRRRQPQVVQD